MGLIMSIFIGSIEKTHLLYDCACFVYKCIYATLDRIRKINTIICGTQATVSGMCGTGIIIQGRIVHESIFSKKALSGTEMIPKQYNTPLRHRKLVGLPMENWPLLGI